MRLPGRGERRVVDDLGRPRSEAAGGAAGDRRDPEAPTELERLVGWLDERTGLAGIVRTTLRKVFPDHWSFLLGEIALFCFVILRRDRDVPRRSSTSRAPAPTTYDGPYVPLQGADGVGGVRLGHAPLASRSGPGC